MLGIFKKIAPVVCAVVACVGVVATAVTATVDTDQAKKDMEDIRKKIPGKDVQSAMKRIIVFVKSYRRPLVIGLVTIIFVVSSTVISHKQQVALMAGYTALQAKLGSFQKRTATFMENAGSKLKEIDMNVESQAENDYGDFRNEPVYIYRDSITGAETIATYTQMQCRELDVNRIYTVGEYGGVGYCGGGQITVDEIAHIMYNSTKFDDSLGYKDEGYDVGEEIYWLNFTYVTTDEIKDGHKVVMVYPFIEPVKFSELD